MERFTVSSHEHSFQVEDVDSSFVEFFKSHQPWDTRRLEELINNGRNVNSVISTDGSRALHVAAKRGDLNIVQTLLNNGANVDVKDYFQKTPIHIAAGFGNYEIIELLLSRTAMMTPIAASKIIDEKDFYGCTALHYAARYAHLQALDVLLDNGADINLQDNRGRNSLHHAVIGNKESPTRFSSENGRSFLCVSMLLCSSGPFD